MPGGFTMPGAKKKAGPEGPGGERSELRDGTTAPTTFWIKKMRFDFRLVNGTPN